MAHRYVLFIIVLAVLISIGGDMSAQTLPTDPMEMGHTYIITFPDTTTTKFDPQHPPTLENRFQAFIYSPVDNVAHVTNNTGKADEYQLSGGTFTTIDFTENQIVAYGNSASNNTYRIEADYPVIVYCYMLTPFGGEAWTPIPVESWATEYYAAALPGEIVRDALPQDAGFIWYETKAAPAEIVILAAYDDTHITIYPHGDLAGYPQTINMGLKANQAYMVQGYVDTNAVATGAPQPDLGATRIVSDKPVGVISGNTRSGVINVQDGLLQNSYKNMLVEWLLPKEEFGTRFAYTPTWDEYRPTGDPNEDLSSKRISEFVRIYAPNTQEETNGYICNGTSGSPDAFSIAPGEFHEERLDMSLPRCITTNTPAQTVMASGTAFAYQGAATQGAGASYRAFTGPYMVNLVPREQWTSFAPFFTPSYPDLSKHYVNVVTDSTNTKKILLKVLGPKPQSPVPFIFNRGPIPGTDLVWGTMQLEAGTGYYLAGVDTSVKFSGSVYGGFSGYEIYDPVRGPANLPQYDERVATSYGYPLASRYAFSDRHDSLDIEAMMCCCTMLNAKIRALGDQPVGLRSAELEGAENARIIYIDPDKSYLLPGRTRTELAVDVIDPSKDARATLVITDRSGHQIRIPYEVEAVGLTLAPNGPIDFGSVHVDQQSPDTVIRVCNPTNHPVSIHELRFARGNQLFEAKSMPLPITIDSNECIEISVNITPNVENKVYDDTLLIETSCPPTFKIPVRAETAEPCLYIGDLPFGVVDLSNPNVADGKTLPLRICNQGHGSVRFEDQGAGLVSWLDKNHFSIDQSSLAMLRDTVLGPDACVTIFVKFTPTDTGVFKTVGRFWANTRNCRDTSVWSAVVIESVPLDAPSTGGALGYFLRGNRPNPFTGITSIEFSLARSGPTRVEIFDDAGHQVGTLVDETMAAGAHRLSWDASPYPSGIYFCRVTSGSWSRSIPMTLLR